MKILVGEKFNKLTVLGLHHTTRHHNFYECKCDCGNYKIVRQQHLLNGNIKSCGCYNRQRASQALKNNQLGRTHGSANTRIYKIWLAMKSRVYNPNRRGYKNYGGREIKICDEWLNFENFYQWSVHNGYNDRLSIDRINTNGDYCPDNCRWATVEVQQNNRRNNHFIEWDGKTYTLAQFSRHFNIPQSTLWARLKRGEKPFGKRPRLRK